MAAARTAARGLSTSDLERIREALATGRKPKVVFTDAAGQIAGQQGQVVELTDPQLNDDWLVVRFGRDELPFSPVDLEIPARATPARRGARPTSSEAGPVPGATVPVPREERTVPVSPTASAAVAPANGKPAPARVKPAAEPPAAPVADKTPNGRAAADKPGGARAVDKPGGALAVDKPAGEPAVAPEAAPPKAKPARKPARPKPSTALTVTLAYSDGEWTVAAHQGTKALAKPYLIRPAEALKMVGMLDVPGVQEAVEEIVAAARSQAEAQAQRLRSELAEIEARLAELREAR